MTDRIWHNGPPPHIGWWNALDLCEWPNEWRWWNGENWSIAVNHRHLPESAGAVSKNPSAFRLDEIQWSDYWPADARVPRLDTTDGHWTFNTGERPKGQVLVEVAYRTGRTTKWRAGAFDWSIEDRGYDIVAWRPAK